MVQSTAFGPEDDDSEIIPLTHAPTYETYDKHDEDLPSYSEAIRDEGNVESQQVNDVPDDTFVFQRRHSSPANNNVLQETFSKRRRLTYLFLVLALIPGIALLTGGIYWYKLPPNCG